MLVQGHSLRVLDEAREVGRHQHFEPENQDIQHMLDQPRGAISRPALSGGMDWWRMEWPFSRVPKIVFRGRNFQENALNSAE